jgi:hypothetical protein
MSLEPLLDMYSGDENRRKRIYSKNSAGSAQNEQFYSKKWSFALLLLTNPLSYTIINNISMEVVAIGGPLSLPIGPQRVIIMVKMISMSVMKFEISKDHSAKSQNKVGRFSFTMGNTIFLVAMHPVCHFLVFQCFLSTLIHQGRLLGKRIIEKEPDLMEKSLRRIKISK